MPRNSVEGAQHTRSRIINEASQQLSAYGVDGTSLAAIASALEMSKSGVVGPFGSRDALLAEAFDAATAIFRTQVIVPAMTAELATGCTRIGLLIDAWVAYLADSPFRGGCILVSASADVDGHDSPLRSVVAAAIRAWRTLLASMVQEAQAAIGIVAADPEVVVDQLVGLSMSLNQSVQLLVDEGAPERVRSAMRRAVGLRA